MAKSNFQKIRKLVLDLEDFCVQEIRNNAPQKFLTIEKEEEGTGVLITLDTSLLEPYRWGAGADDVRKLARALRDAEFKDVRVTHQYVERKNPGVKYSTKPWKGIFHNQAKLELRVEDSIETLRLLKEAKKNARETAVLEGIWDFQRAARGILRGVEGGKEIYLRALNRAGLTIKNAPAS